LTTLFALLLAIPSCQPKGHAERPPVAAVPAGPARGAFALKTVADIPLPGAPVRFDYQSLDTLTNRLYIAHMDAGTLLVFDVERRRVVVDLDGFSEVHGVLAVPELGRIYASVTGRHQIAVVDGRDLRLMKRVDGVDYPDGMAYAPNVRRLFVSDEHGSADVVMDIFADTLVGRIPLGGEAGNTVYDPVSACILVAVHQKNEIAVIDPETNRIVAHLSVAGVERPHGIAIDATRRLAFVAGEANARLGVLDLTSDQVLATYTVGTDPDVLAFDPGWGRLYVASESGTVSALTETETRDGIRLIRDGDFDLPHAHTVAVDPRTHLIYFPLQDLGGGPVLRIMTASPPGSG
jgi:DNA-binding beta-propeller fold protein YncE